MSVGKKPERRTRRAKMDNKTPATKLTRDQILKAIADKNYTIEPDGYCNCAVSNITDMGIEWDTDECWYANVLYIGNEPILQYVQTEGYNILSNAITMSDFDDLDEWETVDSAMGINDYEDNTYHDVEGRVLEYLQELPAGTRFFCDPQNGFANQYTSIILSPTANPNIDTSDWDEITAEQCAADIAYDGDAATKAYNSIAVF